MANIDFFNSNDVPQPPDQIKIERLDVKPYLDGWRVRVAVDVTPFQERPSLIVRVKALDGRVVSELSIIETMVRSMEFTVHIRGVTSPAGDYIAEAALFYGEDASKIQHHVELPFKVEA